MHIHPHRRPSDRHVILQITCVYSIHTSIADRLLFCHHTHLLYALHPRRYRRPSGSVASITWCICTIEVAPKKRGRPQKATGADGASSGSLDPTQTSAARFFPLPSFTSSLSSSQTFAPTVIAPRAPTGSVSHPSHPYIFAWHCMHTSYTTYV